MKALSVIEMPGRAIASGKKTLEVRRWRPESLPLIDLVIVQNKRRLTVEDPIDQEGRVVAVVTYDGSESGRKRTVTRRAPPRGSQDGLHGNWRMFAG
ncbi:MAG: hypothetical protein PF795_02080 [Kiritimatiellae bacterium]|jgi:hypothetical protein|nr:hypothetical protein [Kiritimatiellia bacterium]